MAKKRKPATTRKEIDKRLNQVQDQGHKSIKAIQEHSLTYRKKPVTLWKSNLPNYDDEDHD